MKNRSNAKAPFLPISRRLKSISKRASKPLSNSQRIFKNEVEPKTALSLTLSHDQLPFLGGPTPLDSIVTTIGFVLQQLTAPVLPHHCAVALFSGSEGQIFPSKLWQKNNFTQRCEGREVVKNPEIVLTRSWP